MSRRKRLLLVEDSATQAARLIQLFQEIDLEVVHVPSAELALDQLKGAPPDVIVLDYRLPGMDGNEFCRAIRLNVNTRAIPVLMLTAEDSDAAEMQGLASGADDYVAKSADPDILRVRVSALLRKAESGPAVINIDNRFSRARILAIDDSPTFLYYIAHELKAEHYTVETIEDPRRAIARLEEASFDCVLVDFEMPGLDGAEVCRLIRAKARSSEPEIVLVLLTSHEDKQLMATSFEAGADDYIAKSTDVAVTKARIRALLRRKFLVEENRHILEEIKEKELEAIRARAAREAAEVRAHMADQLAAANQQLGTANGRLEMANRQLETANGQLETANRQLARANQELEQFAYSAAHDLQEPLRKIQIFSQILETKLEGKLDEEAERFFGFCIQGAAQMNQLIRDLLLYAGAMKSAGKPEKAIGLKSALDNALRNLEVLIADSGATITTDELPEMFVDAIRMQQLFQNLIGNAIKYRDPERAPRIHVSAELWSGTWTFSVADNGKGIKAEYREIIFEAFKRLEAGTNPGSGLGLAICKRIVDQLGGEIWVDSEPGKGSTFRFTIPADLSVEVSARAPAGNTKAG